MLYVFLLCILPQPNEVPVAYVDLVEYNHFYDGNGVLVFRQVMFYSFRNGDYELREWHLVKSGSSGATPPLQEGKYFATYIHSYFDGSFKKVLAASRRLSWTQYDPELEERNKLPKDLRRPLFPGNVMLPD